MVDMIVTYRKMFFSLRPARLPGRILFIDMFWSFFSLIDKKNTYTEHCRMLRRPGPLQTSAHLLQCYLLCPSGVQRYRGLRFMVRPIQGLSPYLSLKPPHCAFCYTLLTPSGHFLCKRKFGIYNQISKIPCCNLNTKGPCWSRILLRWILFPPWILPIHWSSACLLIALFCNVFPCSAMFYFCFSF